MKCFNCLQKIEKGEQVFKHSYYDKDTGEEVDIILCEPCNNDYIDSDKKIDALLGGFLSTEGFIDTIGFLDI